MESILDRIFAVKREEVRLARRRMPLESIARQAEAAPAPRDFAGALRSSRPAVIAEIKRASPSKGDIMPDLDPPSVAREYVAAGAVALSVLTDAHFKGSLEDLRAVRAAVEVPLLRKDFIFDPYQVHEARCAGADCILLIAAMLEETVLRSLAALAKDLGMAALVEVHSPEEMIRAQNVGAPLIGINNRDLKTFVTDLGVTERLMAGYAGPALVISESGIDSPEDIRRLDSAGAQAFLIGESLLRLGTPGASLTALMGALGERVDRARSDGGEG